MKYVHAEDVLPPDLVAEVRRHHTGLIYVSADHEFYERRYAQITALRAAGLSTQEIAEQVHLCRRRVQQVLRASRAPEK